MTQLKIWEQGKGREGRKENKMALAFSPQQESQSINTMEKGGKIQGYKKYSTYVFNP